MTAKPAMPALSVIGTPTKRNTILELAAEAERRGFAGLASPGVHGNLALCGSLAHVTNTIPFWTSIQPIYHGHPVEVAVTAGHLHEVSGGRFRLGLGVSHEPAMNRLGIDTGKPLHDMGEYVAAIRAATRSSGELPPIYLATLRDKMLDLALPRPTARSGQTPRVATCRLRSPGCRLPAATTSSSPTWCRR